MWGLVVVLGIVCMILGPAMGCALVGANSGGMVLGTATAALMIFGLCYLYEMWEKREKEYQERRRERGNK